MPYCSIKVWLECLEVFKTKGCWERFSKSRITEWDRWTAYIPYCPCTLFWWDLHREGIGRHPSMFAKCALTWTEFQFSSTTSWFNYFFLSNIPKFVPDVTSVCTTTSSKLWVHKMAPYWEFRTWWSLTLKRKPANKILWLQSPRMLTMYFGTQVPLFYATDGGRWFPCNISTHLQDYAYSHFRTLYS